MLADPGRSVLTERQGQVLVITINRPEARNAVDAEVARGLLAALAELDADTELVVGVITGSGSSFCSGMDLKEFARKGDGRGPVGMEQLYRDGAKTPLIAAVEGVAYGAGLELALICDLVVAASDARFAAPEVKVGLFAAGGALLRLPRLLPPAVAAEMLMTGAPLSARRAHEHGLVVRLVEPSGALDAAIELAHAIAANAPLAVAATKEILRGSNREADAEFWSRQREVMKRVFFSDDAKEGPRAFAERRAPRWSGV